MGGVEEDVCAGGVAIGVAGVALSALEYEMSEGTIVALTLKFILPVVSEFTPEKIMSLSALLAPNWSD